MRIKLLLLFFIGFAFANNFDMKEMVFDTKKSSQQIYTSSKFKNLYFFWKNFESDYYKLIISDNSYWCNVEQKENLIVCKNDKGSSMAYIPYSHEKIQKICLNIKNGILYSLNDMNSSQCVPLDDSVHIPVYYHIAKINSDQCSYSLSEIIALDSNFTPLPNFYTYSLDKLNSFERNLQQGGGCEYTSFSEHKLTRLLSGIIGDVIIFEEYRLSETGGSAGPYVKYAHFLNGTKLTIDNIMKDKKGFLKFLEEYLLTGDHKFHEDSLFKPPFKLNNIKDGFLIKKHSLKIDPISIDYYPPKSLYDYIELPFSKIRQYLNDDFIIAIEK